MTWRVLTVVILLGLFPVPGAMAQGDSDEDMLQTLPNPEELISMVSPGDRWITFVPLEDVAQALGSSLQYDATRSRYSVRSGGDGILEVKAGDAGVSHEAKPRSPGAAAGRINPSAGVLRTPLRQANVAVPQATSFSIDDQVVSKGIIIVGGHPYMPLGDLTAAMGVVVEERPAPVGGTESVYSWQEGARPLLGLSEKGIIIIDNRPADSSMPTSP